MAVKPKKNKTHAQRPQTSSQQHLIPTNNPHTLPPQYIIDLFKHAFNSELYGEETTKTTKDVISSTTPTPSQRDNFGTLTAQIQEVKSYLYNRDYIEAFSTDPRRTAYCIRWSPSRAICYSALLAYLDEIVSLFADKSEGDLKVLCVGGGAGAELVAFASLFAVYTVSNSSKYKKADLVDSSPLSLSVKLVDIADWGNVVDRLVGKVKEHWLNNELGGGFGVDFLHGDVLKLSETELDFQNLNLITMLFTTNELFQEDKVGGVKFLQRLNKYCQAGCLLLIVESAGSYSHITIGSKKFPIQFLIDTTLCGRRDAEDATGAWELLESDDSTWYRYDKDLDYPIQLENMRFFYRLYRKKGEKKGEQGK